MGSRKQSGKEKPQYVKVKAKKSKGSNNSSKMLLRAFTVLLALLVLGGIGFGIWKGFHFINTKLYAENPTFEIQHLEISTDGSLSEDLIRDYANVREGMNLFEFEFKDIEDELLGAPVVESVFIERVLPHTLVIQVKERVPLAQIAGDSRSRFPSLIDRYGHTLMFQRKYAGLPLIVGVEGDLRPGAKVENPAVTVALNIIEEWRSHANYQKYLQIESLDVQYEDYIDMRLEGGTKVLMPHYSVKNKVSKLVATIQTGQSRGERFKKIDMTVDKPKVPVVTF